MLLEEFEWCSLGNFGCLHSFDCLATYDQKGRVGLYLYRSLGAVSIYFSCNSCKTIFGISTKIKELILFYLLCRHKELGPVYVLWLMHKAWIVSTDPDHVKVITVCVMSTTTILILQFCSFILFILVLELLHVLVFSEKKTE